MAKFHHLIIILFLVTSCTIDEKKEVIDDFLIFGYSGFCYKDSLNRIYYSDEILNNDSINLEYDSIHLDIRQYFEFKNDGSVKIAIRKPKQPVEYLSFNSFDTLGFDNLINKYLLNKDYNNNYGFKDNIPVVYDGWYFTLIFKTSKNNSFQINYIPECMPDSLKFIHDYIEHVIIKNSVKSDHRFDLNLRIRNEARRLFKYHPPPKYNRKARIKFY